MFKKKHHAMASSTFYLPLALPSDQEGVTNIPHALERSMSAYPCLLRWESMENHVHAMAMSWAGVANHVRLAMWQ